MFVFLVRTSGPAALRAMLVESARDAFLRSRGQGPPAPPGLGGGSVLCLSLVGRAGHKVGHVAATTTKSASHTFYVFY